MTRARLNEMIDLVLSCKNWGYSDRVDIRIDNSGDHVIYVYPFVNKGGKSTMFYCKDEFVLKEEHGFIYDPEFKKAEAVIRKIKKRVKEQKDDRGAEI